MPSLKKVVEDTPRILLAYLAGAFLWTLGKTYRIHSTGLLTKKDFWEKKEPRIFMFWHNRQLLATFAQRRFAGPDHRITSLISRHRDGRLISRIGKMLGQDSVAGSSTRGGFEAVREMNRLLKEGKHVAITPDGPRGPVYKLKDGVIKLAQISGAYIYPVACTADRKWVFGSWDKMILAKPFARLVVETGTPIMIPKDLDDAAFEKYRDEAEKELNKLTEGLDGYFG